MKSKESLPIKERITKKRYQTHPYKICTKKNFCPNLARRREGKDQFIFVQNKNVSTNLVNVFKSSGFFSELTPKISLGNSPIMTGI